MWILHLFVDFFIKFFNSITLFIVVVAVKLLILLKYYGPIRPMWWFFVNYIYLRHLRVYTFFEILRQIFFFLIFFCISAFIAASFFLIFLIILEDSFLNFSFYACNKALVFFFFYSLVYILMYEDEEISDVFVADFDDWENQWDEFNIEVLDDFENDPEAVFVDLEEDMELEPELDDTEFYWLSANSLEDGDESSYEEDDLLADDIVSNLYFYESWFKYSSRFQDRLIFNKSVGDSSIRFNKNIQFLNLNQKSASFDFFSGINLDYTKFNVKDDFFFFQTLYKLEKVNRTLSDSLLLSLYFLDFDYNIKSPSSFNFSIFSLEGSKYNIFFKFSHYDNRLLEEGKERTSCIYSDSFYFKYFFRKKKFYYFTYNEYDANIYEIDNLSLLNSIAPRYKDRYILEEDIIESGNDLLEYNFDEYDILPIMWAESALDFDIKKLDNFVNFLFRVVLQDKAELSRDISVFYLKNRFNSLFVNRFVFYFLNLKIIKEIVYRRQLLFFVNLMFYNETRYSSLLFLFFSENLNLRALNYKNFDFEDTLYLNGTAWNYLQSKFFNIEWINEENIIFKVFERKDWVHVVVGKDANSNIFFNFLNKRKKARQNEFAVEVSFLSLIYLRLFFVFEDVFFWILFFFSIFFSKISAPFNTFRSFLFLILRYNYSNEIGLIKQRQTFFPYLYNDFFYSRFGFASYPFFKQNIFKFPNALYANIVPSNINVFSRISSFFILNEIFVGLGFYKVVLLNNRYFNNPFLNRLQKKYLDYFFIQKFSGMSYSYSTFMHSSKNFKFYNKLYANKHFGDLFDKFNASFLNTKFSLIEEELFSLILNRVWDFEYTTSKDQFLLEAGEDPVDGYGGTVMVEENGDITTDEFDLLWDWTILNWNLLYELYEDLDEAFGDIQIDASIESGTNYYTYIFLSAIMFWFICKLYRFFDLSGGSFNALVPLYRVARFSDIFRFYFTDFVGSGRNRSTGTNFVGLPKVMIQHSNIIPDEYLRTHYFPLKSRLDSGSLKDFYKWLALLNYKETYVKSHLHLTNGVLTFRRSNTFFKKNSLLWMKYARLNRALIDDYTGFRDKGSFFKNLDQHEQKLEHIIFQRFVDEMKKSFKKKGGVHYYARPKRRRRKRARSRNRARNLRKLVFRYGTRHDPLFFCNSRINDIFYFRDVIKPINGFFNSGPMGKFLLHYKKTELIQPDIKFEIKNYRRDLEALLNLTAIAYREGLRLLLFGSAGTEILNNHINNHQKLDKFERDFLYSRFLKKIKPLNRYSFFANEKNIEHFFKRRRLVNPVVFENIFMRVFLKRLRKSHRFKTNPFMTTAEYFAIYMRRKKKRRKPIREPDIDYVSKMRGTIKSLGLHSFLISLDYNKRFGKDLAFPISNNNIAHSYHSGFYKSLLRNFIQYRSIVRRNFLVAVNRAPHIFRILDNMGFKERDFVLGNLGVLRYLFNLLNVFLGEDFLNLHSSKKLYTNSLFKDDKVFFRWYKAIFKSPFAQDPYIKNRLGRDSLNHSILFNNKSVTWDFERDLEKFFFQNRLYDDLEFYLRFLTREYEWLDDLSVWYDYYEGEELLRTYFLMFLTPFYLKNKLRSFDNPQLSRDLSFKLFGDVRNAPKKSPLLGFFLQKYYGKDIKNVYNHRYNNLAARPGKVVPRMFSAYFLDSLLNSFSLYNWNAISETDPVTPPFVFRHKSVVNEMEEAHLFEHIPYMFRIPQILFINNKRDFIFDDDNFSNEFLVKGYRQFRKNNYKFFFYEKFFNLGRSFVDYMEAEDGYNRKPHFGLHLMLPSQQIYWLEDMASFGSTSYRWYLGSIGDDLYLDTRRSLMNSNALIWPYFLRHAFGLPHGEMPFLKLSGTGGFIPSVKSNAFGYTFYGYRERPHLNSDFFDDMGFEDLNFPPEEEALGLIFLRTFGRFIVSFFLPMYQRTFQYFLDREQINNSGGGLDQRAFWLRNTSYKNPGFNNELQKFVTEEYGNRKTNFNVRDTIYIPSINWKFHRYTLFNSLKRFFYKNDDDSLYFKDVSNKSRLRYIYKESFIFSPLHLYRNSFSKGAAGILFGVFMYLMLYYLVWVPWMYLFFSVNTYFDFEYGKEEPTMDEMKEDMDEIEEDEKAEYELSPTNNEPQDTASRHSMIWSQEISDLVVQYYDPLVFDYTALIEPPYFFYLTHHQLGFYGSSIFNIARNEFIDLENIFIFDPNNKFSYSLLSISEAAEKHFIERAFRGFKPQYSMLFTEFISILTGFEIDDGDIKEEYFESAFIDNKFYSKFPTSAKYFEFIENGFHFGDGFYLKEKTKLLQNDHSFMTADQKYENFYNLGRFTFNDPFKMNSVRTTVWMSLKFLLRGIESLGINYKIYQHNDYWSYVMPVEHNATKFFYNELLCFFPKGIFGYIERNSLLNYDLQYKNGEMMLPLYFRFFRTEDSYRFSDMEGISDFFVNFLESVGNSFLQNKMDSVSFVDMSDYVSIQNSSIVQPANFEGIVSHEMLFGILYLFQQFIYEHSSLKYFDSIDTYILESFAFEINALYSSELMSFVNTYCDYTWSDWLFFFEESTDWALTFDHNLKIEVEDDFVLTLDEYKKLKAEDDAILEEEEKHTFPFAKKRRLAQIEVEKQEMRDLGYPEEAIDLYINHLNPKEEWLYEESIESLILIVDEDELTKEGPFFPDYDTFFSFYLKEFRTDKLALSSSYNDLVLYKAFECNFLNKFDDQESLLNDVFLQFLTMQFVDFGLLFDHFQRYSIYGSSLQMKCSEISTSQNNYYFNLNYIFIDKRRKHFFMSNFNKSFINFNFFNVSFMRKIFYLIFFFCFFYFMIL
jgi:hypothetical protein